MAYVMGVEKGYTGFKLLYPPPPPIQNSFYEGK